MDILPIEVVFNQTLFFVINLYLKLSNFIINYQSSLKTNKSFKSYPQPTQLLLIWLSYEVYQRHSHGIVLHSS